jgi:hypothetical protein
LNFPFENLWAKIVGFRDMKINKINNKFISIEEKSQIAHNTTANVPITIASFLEKSFHLEFSRGTPINSLFLIKIFQGTLFTA